MKCDFCESEIEDGQAIVVGIQLDPIRPETIKEYMKRENNVCSIGCYHTAIFYAYSICTRGQVNVIIPFQMMRHFITKENHHYDAFLENEQYMKDNGVDKYS